MCEHIEESAYKSLNSDLVKGIQEMRMNLNDYKQEIINLNKIILSDREEYAMYKTQLQECLKRDLEIYVKDMYLKMAAMITSFDVPQDQDSITNEDEMVSKLFCLYDRCGSGFLYFRGVVQVLKAIQYPK